MEADEIIPPPKSKDAIIAELKERLEELMNDNARMRRSIADAEEYIGMLERQ